VNCRDAFEVWQLQLSHYCKFSAESASWRILKISQHLVQLWATVRVSCFFYSRGIWDYLCRCRALAVNPVIDGQPSVENRPVCRLLSEFSERQSAKSRVVDAALRGLNIFALLVLCVCCLINVHRSYNDVSYCKQIARQHSWSTLYFFAHIYKSWLLFLIRRRRTFPILRQTASWTGDHFVVKPSAIGQSTWPTQPSIPHGSINE